MTRPTKRAGANKWWTRERVLNGLRRAFRDLYNSDSERVPSSHEAYNADRKRRGAQGRRREYPPATQALNFFPRMIEAWHAAGVIDDARLARHDRKWWTKERVIQAMVVFLAKHRGYAPQSTWDWQAATARKRDRARGWHRRNIYPSFPAIRQYFPTMRQAWEAVERETGVRAGTDRFWEAWREEEDWFIREGVGLMTHSEMALTLRRSPAAVKRRLYELGINSRLKNPWGFSLHWVEQNSPIRRHVLADYLRRGEVPYLQGTQAKYIDLADLVGVVDEVDWSKPRGLSPAFKRECRKSLARRLMLALLRVPWQQALPFRFRQVWARRTPRPDHVAERIWVRVTGEGDYHFARQHLEGRVGRVEKIYWSNTGYSAGPDRKETAAQWMAAVEFPKLRERQERKHGGRVRYHLPVLALEPSEREEWVPAVYVRDEKGRYAGRVRPNGGAKGRRNYRKSVGRKSKEGRKGVAASLGTN